MPTIAPPPIGPRAHHIVPVYENEALWYVHQPSERINCFALPQVYSPALLTSTSALEFVMGITGA